MLLSAAGFLGGFAGTLYLGIEPLVRRNWPDALISLTRLQSGRMRDNLVASHLLIGVAAAGLPRVPALVLGLVSLQPQLSNLLALSSLSRSLGNVSIISAILILVVLGACLLGAVSRMAMARIGSRRLWVADLFTVLVMASPSFFNGQVFSILANLTGFSLALWVVRRFGVLSFAVLMLCNSAARAVPPILGSFWTGRVVFVHVIPVAIGLWALWVILSSARPRSTESAGV